VGDDDRFGAPAMGESGSPDDDLAKSGSPDVDDVGAEDSDRMEAGAESPDARGRLTGAESPDAEPGKSHSADAEEGRSEDLGALPDAAAADAAARRADERKVESSDGIRLDSQIDSIHEAKLAVTTAKERLARAEAAYSEMLTSGYPRGDARQEIIDERDQARADLEAAEKRYDEILRGPARPE